MNFTNIWPLAVLIAWLGCVAGFYVYAVHKDWLESGLLQSLGNPQLYRLAKTIWLLTLSFVLLAVPAFIYLETDLVFKGFPPARVELTPGQYERKLKDRHEVIVQGLELLKDRATPAMLSEKEDLEKRIADIDRDYARYLAWLRSQIYRLETLKKTVPTDLLIKAREALAADVDMEADLYLEKIESIQRARPETAAGIAYMRGMLAKWKADYEKAHDHIVRAANLMADNAGLYKEAGLMAYNVGEYEKSLVYYEAALSLDIRTYGEEHTAIAEDHINLAAVWDNLGDHRKVLEHYEHALAVNQKKHGGKHPRVADNHYRIGFALTELNEYEEAISHFEQGLAIDLEANGRNDSRTVRHYKALGWAWGELKDYKKAIHYYEKALAGNLEIYGENHPEVSKQQSDLGWAWAKLGEYGMSKIYYRLALDGYLKSHGEDHPSVIQARDNLKEISGMLK